MLANQKKQVDQAKQDASPVPESGVVLVDAGLSVVSLKGKPTNQVHTYSDRYKIPAKYKQVTQ